MKHLQFTYQNSAGRLQILLGQDALRGAQRGAVGRTLETLHQQAGALSPVACGSQTQRERVFGCCVLVIQVGGAASALAARRGIDSGGRLAGGCQIGGVRTGASAVNTRIQINTFC